MVKTLDMFIVLVITGAVIGKSGAGDGGGQVLGAREPWRWPVRAGCMLTVGSGIAITYWRVGKCVEWEELELELDRMGVG